MLSRLPRNAPVWLDRLSAWLEPFEVCFSHVAQRGAFRRYLLGLLSDSRRKSMSAMLERVTDPGTYQSFQHFITHAPWRAERVWQSVTTNTKFKTEDALDLINLCAFAIRSQNKGNIGGQRWPQMNEGPDYGYIHAKAEPKNHPSSIPVHE